MSAVDKNTTTKLRNMQSKLQEIGLSKKESNIYLALVISGENTASGIAKKTTILRSSIYDYLETLLEKGFVSYTYKSHIKYFQAVEPDKILDRFYEQKNKEEKKLKKIIPELSKIKKETKHSNIDIFEGKEGIKTVLSYCLKKNKEVLLYGASGTLRTSFPVYIEKWQKERSKLKIPIRMIYNDTLTDKEIKKRQKYKYMKVRHINNKELSYSNTIIYDNSVLLIVIDNALPFAILIENNKLYKNYKNNFEILWKQAKEYK